MARSAMDHSGLFSDKRAIRSPGLIPISARPSATWRTRDTKSSAEMLIQSLSTLWFKASDFPCFNEAPRHKPGTDEIDSRLWLLASVWAEATEDTLGTPGNRKTLIVTE